MALKGNTMALTLPESVKQLLTDKAYGHVVTINPDGSPQCAMVRMDVDGDFATYNTAEGRLKVRNLVRIAVDKIGGFAPGMKP